MYVRLAYFLYTLRCLDNTVRERCRRAPQAPISQQLLTHVMVATTKRPSQPTEGWLGFKRAIEALNHTRGLLGADKKRHVSKFFCKTFPLQTGGEGSLGNLPRVLQ